MFPRASPSLADFSFEAARESFRIFSVNQEDLFCKYPSTTQGKNIFPPKELYRDRSSIERLGDLVPILIAKLLVASYPQLVRNL